jgi:hypothetical protein
VSSAGDSVRRSTYSQGVDDQTTTVNGAETDVETGEAQGFKVILRLADGERVEAGSFAEATEAHGFAEQFISTAAAGKAWPRIGDRYLRPEVIISIDVVPDDHPRWTGSTGRASSWTGRPGTK